MNVIESIQRKIVNLKALEKIITSYDFDSTSFVLDEHKKMLKPIDEQINFLYMLYKKLGLDKSKSKHILDIGSGFCYNNILCKLLKHKCDNLERPPKEHIDGHESNLFKYFHKILKIKNIEYYEIISPIVHFKNKQTYDFIFILNPTFNEKEMSKKLATWDIEDWKIFLKSLHKNLKPEGKIILGLNKSKITDPNFNKDWNKFSNSIILKYKENKIVDFFDKHTDYKVLTLSSLKI